MLEVKSTAADVVVTAHSAQVAGYLARYGLVLVTNYRDFVLVDAGLDGLPRLLERYALAPSETNFWRSTVGWLLDREGKLVMVSAPEQFRFADASSLSERNPLPFGQSVLHWHV